MTGFSPAVRKVIREREGGRCARCSGSAAQIHHRRPRGMGGTSQVSSNQAANGLYLCPFCHQEIEANPVWGRVFGYLVPQGVEPAEVVVFYKGGWVLLDDDGNINPATVEGELLKTVLTEADREKVWRSAESEWLHYAWSGDRWECYPCDPRRHVDLGNHWAARTNSEGLVEHKAGLVEVL